MLRRSFVVRVGVGAAADMKLGGLQVARVLTTCICFAISSAMCSVCATYLKRFYRGSKVA